VLLAGTPQENTGESRYDGNAFRPAGAPLLPFRSRFMVTFNPERPDFSPYGFTCVRWTPTPMLRPDRHNEIEINFLESGSVTYLFGGRKVRVCAGCVSAFWAAIPHQIIEIGTTVEYFVATIPLAWFLQCKLPDPFVQAVLHGRVVSSPNEKDAGSDGAQFTRWEQGLATPSVPWKKVVMLEMEARLLRLAISHDVDVADVAADRARKPHRPFSDGSLKKVEQMACLIAQRYTDQLTVAEISRAVNLHANYAMTLFHKAFGIRLVEYINQHRISHAQRLLATTDEKIVDVAFASGFNSISRFNSVFRQACNCTPRQYRQQNRMSDS
jgi:AraC-like DNA-binding protein